MPLPPDQDLFAEELKRIYLKYYVYVKALKANLSLLTVNGR